MAAYFSLPRPLSSSSSRWFTCVSICTQHTQHALRYCYVSCDAHRSFSNKHCKQFKSGALGHNSPPGGGGGGVLAASGRPTWSRRPAMRLSSMRDTSSCSTSATGMLSCRRSPDLRTAKFPLPYLTTLRALASLRHPSHHCRACGVCAVSARTCFETKGMRILVYGCMSLSTTCAPR